MRRRLIIFVKAPIPGLVKTRLASDIGPESALNTYLNLVRVLLSTVRPRTDVELRFTPDDAKALIEPWRQPGWILCPQGPGNLGARLDRAFSDAFQQGARRVLALGSDCPYVEREDIDLAYKALQDRDVVLGPATDGGYWLIGLRKPLSSLFRRMPWSQPDLAKETFARARASGVSVKRLRILEDVDDASSHQRFLHWMPASGGTKSPPSAGTNPRPTRPPGS